MAARNQHPAVLEYLLEKGADVNKRSKVIELCFVLALTSHFVCIGLNWLYLFIHSLIYFTFAT